MEAHMDRFEFFDSVPAMPQHERQMIIWANAIAKEWHGKEIRDCGERYYEHPRRGYLTLIQHGYHGAAYGVCTLLHDILENTYFPLSMLEPLFGHDIARSIVTVSKSYCLEDPLTGRMIRMQPKSKEVYFASIRRNGKVAALAKVTDRIDNQSDLLGDQPEGSRWTPEKRLKQIEETREWILPLAEMHEPRFAEILMRQCAQIEQNATAAIARRG
jgi:(p)ppGpp synthase/HD superfamily hydrolase